MGEVAGGHHQVLWAQFREEGLRHLPWVHLPEEEGEDGGLGEGHLEEGRRTSGLCSSRKGSR